MKQLNGKQLFYFNSYSYDESLRIKPNDSIVWYYKGNVFSHLQ